MKEIYHSKEAELIQEYHCNGNHSNCNPNACPYVANGTVKENEIEIDKNTGISRISLSGI